MDNSCILLLPNNLNPLVFTILDTARPTVLGFTSIYSMAGNITFMLLSLPNRWCSYSERPLLHSLIFQGKFPSPTISQHYWAKSDNIVLVNGKCEDFKDNFARKLYVCLDNKAQISYLAPDFIAQNVSVLVWSLQQQLLLFSLSDQ